MPLELLLMHCLEMRLKIALYSLLVVEGIVKTAMLIIGLLQYIGKCYLTTVSYAYFYFTDAITELALNATTCGITQNPKGYLFYIDSYAKTECAMHIARV